MSMCVRMSILPSRVICPKCLDWCFSKWVHWWCTYTMVAWCTENRFGLCAKIWQLRVLFVSFRLIFIIVHKSIDRLRSYYYHVQWIVTPGAGHMSNTFWLCAQNRIIMAVWHLLFTYFYIMFKYVSILCYFYF